jgi:hypothetical protein
LKSIGIDCPILTQNDGILEHISHPIVVAPHEFFHLPLEGYASSDQFLSRSICFNTEQLISPWFNAALPAMLACRAVIDINFQTALIFGSDFPAIHVLPPFDESLRVESFLSADPSHPLFRWLPDHIFTHSRTPQPLSERHFDLFFAGYKTPERDKFFTIAAPYLAEKQCFLAYATLPDRPTAAQGNSQTSFFNNVALSAATKIILNLHRYPIGFFEWERTVATGFASSACVVATHGLPSPFFSPGRDYIESISRNVDKVIRWLLDDSDGRAFSQQVATNGKASLDKHLTAQRVGRFLASFLADLED